ncbi:DUF2339 domain-containing protein [Pseudogulbenkiania sp. MAI-1]|uniref:DUF2339 domain-containing protein n=1 Tax=Pseudogulbenkiania sp. MAI-1 TaxID=990370 RepID=UPI001E5630BC|nr:DUF2339 domain-containing protein [Pseudogulbenkiania sp. MAI-1]
MFGLQRETEALRRELAALKGQAVETEEPAEPVPAVEATIEATPPFIEEEAAMPPGEAVAPKSPPPTPVAVSVEPEAIREPVIPLWQRLLAGNLLAKIGVVLLFFGVASALRLAADYGLLPVPLRLLLGTLAGGAMIGFGWNRVHKGVQPTFGIALQGGGFAILYLIVYFMHVRYGMFGATSAFLLFALLGVACVLFAVAQDGVVLASFGLAGAFAAPVLAATGSNNPTPLFAYFALLNTFIVGVSWFKNWRLLNVTGFLMTIGVGMAWAIEHYRADYHGISQAFLIFFWGLYSAMPALMALFRAPGWAGWSDGTLVFGTPLIGFALQSQLAADRYELAWAALAAALYYLALWALLFRRRDEALRLLERCQLGLGIAFGTLVAPLAFGVQVTAAFWSLEGVAVLWFGVVQRRRLAMVSGSGLQVAAAAYFLYGLPQMQTGLPVINDIFLGLVMLAGAGLASARLLRRFDERVAAPVLLWAFFWWGLAGWSESERHLPLVHSIPVTLTYIALSLIALEIFGRRSAWNAARHLSLLLLPVLWLAAGAAWLHGQHMLSGLMVLALPLSLAGHYWLLARQQTDGMALWPAVRHLGAFWLGMLLVSVELAWLGDRLAPGVTLWPVLALAVGPLGGVWLAVAGARRGLPPVAAAPFVYRGPGALLPVAWLVLWLLWTGFAHDGGGSGLPYVPLLNPFDLVQLATLATLYRWLRGFEAEPWPGLPLPRANWVGVLAFVWISCLAGRIAHHWGGVPFEPDALWHSTLLQAMLTLLWTTTAIAAMIRAAGIGLRWLWQLGFALLAVVGAKLLFVDLANAGTLLWTGSLIGVALLVLAASYFAPVPPAGEKRGGTADQDGRLGG